MHWLGNHAPSCSESWNSWEKGRNEPLLDFWWPPSSGTRKGDAEPAQMWQPDGQLLKIATGRTLLFFVCWPLGQSFEM